MDDQRWVEADSPNGDLWTYGYVVVDEDPVGRRAIQVMRFRIGYGPVAWVLDFTERADPMRRLVVRVKCDPRGVALHGLASIMSAIRGNTVPTTLNRLQYALDANGISDVTGQMPYAKHFSP